MRRRWLAIGVIAGAVAMIAGGAYAAGGTGQSLNLSSGGSVTVTCPNTDTLGVANQQTDSVDVGCTANPPVTTTTVPAPTTTTTTAPSPPPPPGACPQFLEAPSSAQAFCDTLGTPAATAGTRSGQLDGVLWGVSRTTQNDNPGQGQVDSWASSNQNQCGASVTVRPDGDVNMCNSELVESFNDAGASGELAMYPRQPFDFAGRTGTVEFNVSDDSEGGHAAWPTFVITDQPVPAPSDGSGLTTPGLFDLARNSVGVSLFSVSPPASCVTAEISATSNYQPMGPATNTDGCVQEPPQTPLGSPGQLMHVEIQVNATGVKVFMGGPGDLSHVHLIADSSFQVPLTRGLVWLTDVHYNGSKFNNQGDHTFGWSDLAFDGPVLSRDLGFDVPDASPSNLGYVLPATVQTGNAVTAANIAAATGALVEFNYDMPQQQTMTVTLDGSPPVQMQMPNVPGWGMQTIAIPVPLSDVRPGVQSIQVSSTASGDMANVDLILQGAG